MDLGARDVHEKQFHDQWRGYNQEEVDVFLDRVAETLDRLQRENRALRGRSTELEQTVATSRDTEEMLKKTLVTAQQAAEEAIAKAKAKAEQLLTEAEQRAHRSQEDVKERLAAAEVDLRRKTLDADREFTVRRKELETSIDRLRAFEADLKQRLKTFLEQQLRTLDVLEERESPSAPAPAAARQSAPLAAPSGSPHVRVTEGAPGASAAALRGEPDRSEPPARDQAESAPAPTVRVDETAPAGHRRGMRGLFTRDDH